MAINIKLADYLFPRGTRPYSSLADDLEHLLQQGNTVYLISVPGFLMVAGHPDMKSRPWSDGNLWYKTAKDAIDKRNGKP